MSLLTLVGLGLRVWGISFGLPQRYHIDEQFYVPWSLRLLNGDVIMPATTHGPNLYIAILSLQDVLVYAVKVIQRVVSSPAQFAALYEADPGMVYLPARLLSAVAGAATVPVTYLVGREAGSHRAGAFGATVMALCFLHVRNSHYAVPDVFMTFMFVCTTWLILRAVRRGGLRDFCLAGVAVGLTSGVKLTAGVAVLPLLMAVVTVPCVPPAAGSRWIGRARCTWLGRLALTALVALGAFLLAYPVPLLSPSTFLEDLRIQASWARSGFPPWQLDRLPAASFYLRTLADALGVVPFALGLLGAARALVAGAKPLRLVALLVLVYYAFISVSRYYFARFALPMLPLLAVLGGAFLWSMAESLSAKARHSALGRIAGSSWFLVAAVCACMAPSLACAVRHDWILTQADTRTIAKSWIEQNLPAGTRIAVDWPTHTPPLSTASDSVPDSTVAYHVTTISGSGLSDHDLGWYREQGFEYLVASSYIYDIPLSDHDADRERAAFYLSLDQQLRVVAQFWPSSERREAAFAFDEIYGPITGLWQRERPGPTLKIYALR